MSNPRQALRQAISDKWAADPNLEDTITGGLHYVEAPAGEAEAPLVTFFFVDDVPVRDLRQATAAGYDYRVQFDCYSTDPSPDEVEEMATLMDETFDRRALVFADTAFVWVDSLRQETIGPLRSSTEPADGGWHCTFDYLIKFDWRR